MFRTLNNFTRNLEIQIKLNFARHYAYFSRNWALTQGWKSN